MNLHAYVVNVYHDGSNIAAIKRGEEPMVGPYHDSESLDMAAHAMQLGGGNPWLIAATCECSDEEIAER